MWDLANTFFHRESTKALKGVIHSSWRSFRDIHPEEGWQRGWGQSDRWWDLRGGLPDHLDIPSNTSYGAKHLYNNQSSRFCFSVWPAFSSSLSSLPPSLTIQHGLWNHGSLTRIEPWPTAVKAQSRNPWTTREFSLTCFLGGLKPSNQKMGDVFFFPMEVGSHFLCCNKSNRVMLLISSVYMTQAKLGLWPLWKFKNDWECPENFRGNPTENHFKRE